VVVHTSFPSLFAQFSSVLATVTHCKRNLCSVTFIAFTLSDNPRPSATRTIEVLSSNKRLARSRK
jgi:hypothetical protein